jgi:hypothetical protein
VTPSSRTPRSSGRRLLNLLVFVAVLALGGIALVPVYHWAHPGKSGSAKTSAAAPAAERAKATATPVVPTASRAAAPKADGLIFDDFSYSGGSDPSLAAHGWQVRTDPGGPGINSTWKAGGVSFPKVASAQGGHAMQLQLTSDGTASGTRQSELRSAEPLFQDGTYAARVYFTDGPAVGRNGDHFVEAFYAISPPKDGAPYSELDYEYLPNGGWGSKRPELDTTSWRTSKQGDRVYHPSYARLHGWHTVMVTSQSGKVSYYLDGAKVFSSSAPYALHGPVGVAFSTWMIDLPFAGQRTWNMQVNWFYYQAGKVQAPGAADQAVKGYYADSTHFVDTLAGH